MSDVSKLETRNIFGSGVWLKYAIHDNVDIIHYDRVYYTRNSILI